MRPAVMSPVETAGTAATPEVTIKYADQPQVDYYVQTDCTVLLIALCGRVAVVLLTTYSMARSCVAHDVQRDPQPCY